jgi:hypothetical protein
MKYIFIVSYIDVQKKYRKKLNYNSGYGDNIYILRFYDTGTKIFYEDNTRHSIVNDVYLTLDIFKDNFYEIKDELFNYLIEKEDILKETKQNFMRQYLEEWLI